MTAMLTSYGSFYGGDPRRFHPDPECSTDAERAAHAEACKAWDRGERPPEPLGHESHYDASGKLIKHINRNPYGLGITVDEIEENEPEEPDLELEEMEDEELYSVYLSNAGADSDRAMEILAERFSPLAEREAIEDGEDE
jgi:hypothetical protein